MKIGDSRRLTGPNLQHTGAGAVAEVTFEPNELVKDVLAAWEEALDRLLQVFDLEGEPRFIRQYEGGAAIGFAAPIDQLYAATEMNEWAIEWANARMRGEAEPSFEEVVARVRKSVADELNPGILALQREAAAREIPFIWDDDYVSIGMGVRSETWETSALPEVASIEWERLAAIPVVLITGTNGKTTTSRLVTRILKRAGFAVGSTSTDGVCVDEIVVEGGDWTGPGAARMVLRRKDVDVAVLETARGGLLRRGIGVDAADVSLVTNVGDDHLGDYGVQSVPDMARVKNLICSVVKPGGARVLNADDPELVTLGDAYDSPLIWFSVDPENPIVRAHCASGGEAWVCERGEVVRLRGVDRRSVLRVDEIPLALGGAALHNVSNALGAAAIAGSLGVSEAVIAEALRSFGASWTDNPGRCHRARVGGVDFLFDFGHNPHGIRAVLGMARRLLAGRPQSRLAVSIGQAGDRSDRDIHNLAQALMAAEPELVLARDIPGYERGREEGEVARLLRSELLELGMPRGAIQLCRDEMHAVNAGLSWAKPGDLVVTLVHLRREDVACWLAERGGIRL
jgi:UDP-N-acetylmuramyl tripeptide synthase